MTTYELRESASFQFFDDWHSYRFCSDTHESWYTYAQIDCKPIPALPPPVRPSGSYVRRCIWMREREREKTSGISGSRPDGRWGDPYLSNLVLLNPSCQYTFGSTDAHQVKSAMYQVSA